MEKNGFTVQSALGITLLVISYCQSGWGSSFSAPAQAKPEGCAFLDPDAARAGAKSQEAICLNSRLDADDTVSCLDQVTDIIWHCTGDLSEMIRVLNEQLGLNPSDPTVAFDLMSSVGWLSYSVEDDEILNKKIADFTSWPFQTYLDREIHYRDSFTFFHEAQDIATLVIANQDLGSVQIKKFYYAKMKQYYLRSEELFSGLSAQGVPQADLKLIELQMSVHRKILDRYQQYDDQPNGS